MVVENRFLSSPPLELFKELLKDILNLTFLVKKNVCLMPIFIVTVELNR
jgi:hypothetical protein